MPVSPRAIHRAVQARLNARFATDWLERPPFSHFHERFLEQVRALKDWPAPERYDALAHSVPRHLQLAEAEQLPRFVAHDRATLQQAGGYEQHVVNLRAVPTRARNWHDFFNMAVWAHFPRLRWALNAVHVDRQHGRVDPRNGRTLQQNAAAQLDESGMIVTSSSPGLLQDLRNLQFKRAFWDRRAELLETTRFWLIGHGSLESLLAPHLGLASKAILLSLEAAQPSACELREQLDARVSAIVRNWRAAAPRLDPLPMLGIPGYADNDSAEFYDNPRYFRFERRPR